MRFVEQVMTAPAMLTSPDGAVIAVDVGGTSIKGALVDADGHFMRELARATPAARGPDAVISEVQAVVAELGAAAPGPPASVRSVAVVIPGSSTQPRDGRNTRQTSACATYPCAT